MFGGNSPLSGGDTYGYLQTNACKTLFFEGGTYIAFGDTPGYIEVNTTGGTLYNVEQRGAGVAAAALDRCFYTNANDVEYFLCKVSTRISNTNIEIFKGSATAEHNRRSKYIGCQISDVSTTGGTLKVFSGCYNISNPYITTTDSTSGIITIFANCKRISNSYVYNVDNSAESIVIYDTCDVISGLEADTVAHSGAVAAKGVTIFDTCTGVDRDSFKLNAVTTNGAGGEVKIYDSCTFQGNNLEILTKTADYTIDLSIASDVIVANPNTVSQYGTLTITLPDGASTNGQVYTIVHGTNQGLVSVAAAGADNILYKGESLTSILLYDKGNKLKVYYDGSNWIIDKLESIMKIGWQNRSDWTNVHMGNGVTYDNKSAGIDLTGMVITEATSGFTGVVVEDTGGTVSPTGTLYIYELSSGFTFWTNNRQLTASDGTTCDVHEASGSSKNIDYNLYHGFGVNLKIYSNGIYSLWSTDGTEANSFNMPKIDQSNDLGAQTYQVNTNSFKYQSGASGIRQCNDSGSTINIDIEDWYLLVAIDFSK